MPKIGSLIMSLDEAVQLAKQSVDSVATGASGAASGEYSAKDRAQAELEKNSGKRGASVGFYDPELAAFLSGDL